VGELISVVERSGLEHMGKLAKIDDRVVVLEKSIAYGSFSYEIQTRDVSTIRLVVEP
jgi:hypothetical protein